ncbi:MAG: 50S ribosomal protein L18 [uncultured bacterium]|nr:MAG: 50S ribosomal protein L18 [uncultured bacterium]HCU70234.1 50S ribosomal protein L18 [Candidatus Moranbacteria bacterium]
MKKLSRNQIRLHRKRRIRAKISGTNEVPRLAVFRSLRNVSAQVIDDISGKTIASASLFEVKGKNTVVGAKEVGKVVAEKCKTAKIEKVVFDRSGYKYHGKVKAVADGAREAGLKF